MLTPHGMQASYDSKVMIVRTIVHPSERSVDKNKKRLWTGMNQRNGRVLRRYEIHIRGDLKSVSRQQGRLQRRHALGAHVCGMGERVTILEDTYHLERIP